MPTADRSFPMNAGYISAMAALAGSAIGALASLATTWALRQSQTRATQRAHERARCDALYGEFIREAAIVRRYRQGR